MIEFVTSRNSSKHLRKFHQEIVATSDVSFIFMKTVKIQPSASDAEGRLRSQQSLRDVGWTKGHQNKFLALGLRRFSPVSIFPPWLHNHTSVTYHRRYIILANEVATKKFKTESLWIPGM
jgi:hypothetical protein